MRFGSAGSPKRSADWRFTMAATARKWLIASNASAGQLYVYDHAKDDAYVGALTVSSGGAAGRRARRALSRPAPRSAQAHGALLIVGDERRRLELQDRAVRRIARHSASAPGRRNRWPPPSPRPSRSSIRSSRPIRSPTAATPRTIRRSGPIRRTPPRAGSSAPTSRAAFTSTTCRASPLQFAADGKMNNVDLREGFAWRHATSSWSPRATGRTRPSPSMRSTRHRSARQCRRRHPADRPVGSLWPVHVPQPRRGRPMCSSATRTAWSGSGSWSRRAPARFGQSRSATSSSAARPKAASSMIERHPVCRGRGYRPVAA